MNKRNLHMGSSFESFLVEHGALEEATAVAIKRALARKMGHDLPSVPEDGSGDGPSETFPVQLHDLAK